MAEAERLAGLDALRGMAAFAIVVFHAVMLLTLIPEHQLPYWFKSLGIAVPLFFAISAFALCVGYFGKLTDTTSIGRFYLRRFLRIAPLYYLMIFAWVLTYSYLWGQWRLPSASELALNITFLFTFFPTYVTSLVAAGWSLGVEMVFYAAFPLLIVLLRDAKRATIAMIVACGVVIAVGILCQSMPNKFARYTALSQAPFFAGGMFLFHVYAKVAHRPAEQRRKMALMLLALPVALLSAFSLIEDKVELQGWNAERHIIGLTLLPLVLSFALSPTLLFVNRATVFLGQISYGVYLLHPLVIVVIVRPLNEALTGELPIRLKLMVMVATTLAITIPLAAVSYFGFERRISRWRPQPTFAAEGVRASRA